MFPDVIYFAGKGERDDQYLEHNGDTDDAHKEVITKNSLENVEFIWLSCVELVEDLTKIRIKFVFWCVQAFF